MRADFKNKGFTLIELLVVISIISLLSSIVLASLQGVRSRGRDSQRLQNMQALKTALELYRNDNSGYPSTGGSGNWRGACSQFGSHALTGSGGYIPNLAPTYIRTLPQETYNTDISSCYLYTSNGTDYMILAYKTVENGPVPASLQRTNANPPSSLNTTYAVFSSGASGW